MDLASMTPQNALASTNYCLANPGREYLVYQPSAVAFTVSLQAGVYNYEWFNPVEHAVVSTGTLTAVTGDRSFIPPTQGEAVLYLATASHTRAKER